MTTGIARLSGNVRQIIRVNYDRLRADGRLLVHGRRFFPVQPELGAKVHCVDEDGDEELSFNATITSFTEDWQQVYLTMDWANAEGWVDAEDPYDETDTTVEEFRQDVG